MHILDFIHPLDRGAREEATAIIVDVVVVVGAIGYLLWPNNIGGGSSSSSSGREKQKYADDRKSACMDLACIIHRKSADDERERERERGQGSEAAARKAASALQTLTFPNVGRNIPFHRNNGTLHTR